MPTETELFVRKKMEAQFKKEVLDGATAVINCTTEAKSDFNASPPPGKSPKPPVIKSRPHRLYPQQAHRACG